MSSSSGGECGTIRNGTTSGRREQEPSPQRPAFETSLSSRSGSSMWDRATLPLSKAPRVGLCSSTRREEHLRRYINVAYSHILRKAPLHCDALVVTHGDADHYAGLTKAHSRVPFPQLPAHHGPTGVFTMAS